MVYVILKLDAREEEKTKEKSERETERQRQRQRKRGREEGKGEGEKLEERREGACLEQILYNSSLLFEDCQGLLLIDSLCE